MKRCDGYLVICRYSINIRITLFAIQIQQLSLAERILIVGALVDKQFKV
ncbi:hypothetical protein [Pelosinus fermentans]|nr:hypothetical protein [Pelosinus fermentans]